MIRDRSSEKEHKNVPDLEPEEDSVIREEEPAEEHIPEEKTLEQEEADAQEIDVNEIFEDFPIRQRLHVWKKKRLFLTTARSFHSLKFRNP